MSINFKEICLNQNPISKELLEIEIHKNKLSIIKISEKYKISIKDIIKLQKKYNTQILNIDGQKLPRQLTYEQKQLILGSCLGNGILFRNENGCGLKIYFPVKNNFYTDIKFNILRPYIRTAPTIQISKFRNKSCRCKSFKTLTHDYFEFLYYSLRDKTGKIHIYKNMLEKLDICGLSILYMDIGVKKKYSYDFLFNFGIEDQQVFCDWLKYKLNIEARVIKHKDKYKTRILRQSMNEFKKVINIFIVDEFKYKI